MPLNGPEPDAAAAVGAPEVIAEYVQICDGLRADGPNGTIAFCVSTDDLDEGRGDLFVAVGLARALSAAGWGVRMWPMRRWSDPLPAVDVAVSMIESFVPGGVAPDTMLLAWVRNWTSRWIELPFLGAFDGFLVSSTASADAIRAHYAGPIELFPIGVDLDLFTGDADAKRPLRIVTTANFWGVERDLQRSIAPLAARHPIDWYGTSGRYLRVPAGITHRGTVPFGRMPELYRSAQLVLDDLIESARRFGNQNSRLFEAIASGALPVTNTADGLAELGLASVPHYADSTALLAIAEEYLDDEQLRSARVAELQRVVRSRHSYAARAEQFAVFVTPLAAAARPHRPDWLGWATATREALRSVQFELDETKSAFHDQHERAKRLQSELTEVHARLHVVASRLHAIETHPLYRALSRMRRLVRRPGASHPGARAEGTSTESR